MSHEVSYASILQPLYADEEALAGFYASLGFPFSPVPLSSDVATPGVYDLPSLGPETTQAVTYAAAGTSVSDTYGGISLWGLLNAAGGVTVTGAKNDLLSKYVVATGSDGYKAVFSLGPVQE